MKIIIEPMNMEIQQTRRLHIKWMKNATISINISPCNVQFTKILWFSTACVYFNCVYNRFTLLFSVSVFFVFFCERFVFIFAIFIFDHCNYLVCAMCMLMVSMQSLCNVHVHGCNLLFQAMFAFILFFC